MQNRLVRLQDSFNLANSKWKVFFIWFFLDFKFKSCFSIWLVLIKLRTRHNKIFSQKCSIGLSDCNTLQTFQTQNVSWRGGIEDNYQIATHNFSLELSQETILFWVEVMIKVNHIIFFLLSFFFYDNPWAKWNLCYKTLVR